MVEAYRFDSKDECLNFLKELFKNEKYRNIQEVKFRAELYAKHNKELYDFFIKEGEKLLSSYEN